MTGKHKLAAPVHFLYARKEVFTIFRAIFIENGAQIDLVGQNDLCSNYYCWGLFNKTVKKCWIVLLDNKL